MLGRGLHMRARHLLTERWTGTGYVVASAVSPTASRRHPMSIDTDLDPRFPTSCHGSSGPHCRGHRRYPGPEAAERRGHPGALIQHPGHFLRRGRHRRGLPGAGREAQNLTQSTIVLGNGSTAASPGETAADQARCRRSGVKRGVEHCSATRSGPRVRLGISPEATHVSVLAAACGDTAGTASRGRGESGDFQADLTRPLG